MCVLAEKSTFPDQVPHRTYTKQPVKLTACHQPLGLWSEEPHDTEEEEEEGRIIEEWEEERRSRVMYRVKEIEDPDV